MGVESESYSIIHPDRKNLPLPKNCINITYISPEQTQWLQTRIAANEGLIRIFMHPRYEKSKNSQYYDKHVKYGLYPRLDRIEKGIFSILSHAPETTPPVFIFEQFKDLNGTAGFFANEISGNEIYMVPTQIIKSEPKFSEPYVYDKVPNNNWERLIECFDGWGVKNILIGGMRFSFRFVENSSLLDPRSDSFRQQLTKRGVKNTNFNTYGCVGHGIDKLAKHFNIEVSGLTFPCSRKDLM